MGRKTLTSFVLPLVVFPTILALGAKFMYADHIREGIDRNIHALCNEQTKPAEFPKSYTRKYTAIAAIDDSEPGICALVAFFHLLLDAPTPVPRAFLAYLLGTGLPCMLVPFVEGHRGGKRDWLIRWPIFWLAMAQGVTIAMTLPIYFMLLILSTNGRLGGVVGAAMAPEDATALLVGLLVGAVLPSAAMMLVNDAWTTWAWQFYPLFIALVRDAYLWLRAPAKIRIPAAGKASATSAMHALYAFCFAVAVGTHAYFVWPLLSKGRYAMLRELVIPSIASSSMHPSEQSHNFLKWDYFLGSLSVLVALLWTAKGWRQMLNMLVWYGVAVPVLGAGGAVMGILIWRDL